MLASFASKRAALEMAPALMLCWLAALEAGVRVGWGDEPVPSIGNSSVQDWQVDQDLPQMSVTSKVQPPGGYLWTGTSNGLTRFDPQDSWERFGADTRLAHPRAAWWLRALMAVGTVGLVFGGYELRLHRVRRERVAQEIFSRRLVACQENERRRLAGVLHDEIGQDLLIIASHAQLSLSCEENSPAGAARLKDIAETAKHALQHARSLAHNLRPGLLDELGLAKALQASAHKAARASGRSIDVNVADVDGLMPPEFEVNLFRIAQEALNNVLKHAGASQTTLTLTQEPASLRLIVEDNGQGFEPDRRESPSADQPGFGLRQMAERARMMGGRFDLQSQPGHGTRVAVEVPLQGSNTPDPSPKAHPPCLPRRPLPS